MITMMVFKDSGAILMCNAVDDDTNNYSIQDYVEIKFAQTGPQNISPVPVSYPAPFIDKILTDAGSNIPLKIKKEDVILYSEDYIKKDMIDLYRSVIAQRSGIQLATTMPKAGSPLILKG